MKTKQILTLLLAAAIPFVGFSKSKLKTLTFGDIVLEPEDSLIFALEDMEDSIDGYEVMGEYLPDGVEVEWTGKKFKTPKAGKVKYSKKEGDFVSTSDDNPAGLKISINKKTGKVSGSFKVYVAKSETKVKAYTAKFSGKIGEELKCTIKKISGSFSAVIDE